RSLRSPSGRLDSATRRARPLRPPYPRSAARSRRRSLAGDSRPDDSCPDGARKRLCPASWRGTPTSVEVRGAYSNIKDQVSALEELGEKLPSLDTPEPSSIKRDRPRRARQLGAHQVEELIAGYQSGATVYELGNRFGIERRTVSN